MMRYSFLCVMVLGACAVDGVDQGESGQPGDDNATVTETNVPRIAANALGPAALAGSTLTTVQLTTTSAAAMAANSNARSTLGYAVGCALDSTQSITFTVGTTNYTLTGSAGIATAWTSRALTSTEAAWVSACVLARVNLTSTSVTISMRGSNSGLVTTSDELTGFQIEEGAFWGNVYTNLGTIAGFACDGVDQAKNDTYGDLPLRQCAQPDTTYPNITPCGFSYAGLCTAACTTGSPYGNCSYNGTASTQVITTFLSGTPQY